LSSGSHVLPPSVLFHSGRAPIEGCKERTSGKSTESVVPAMYAAPVESTAMAASLVFWLPPKKPS